MSRKKFTYLFLAVVGGGLIGFLIHALLELWYIPRLISHYDVYGLGLSWDTWFKIHQLLVITLTGGGTLLGIYLGQVWWRCIYVNKQYQGWYQSMKKHFVIK